MKMNKLFFILTVFVSNLSLAQAELSIPKIDTLYFTKKQVDFKKSKTENIIKNFPYLCNKEVDKEMQSDFAFSESEEISIAMLNELNSRAKNKIFTQAEAIVAVYFCKDLDMGIGTKYYEFLFLDEKKASLAFKKLDLLFKKSTFNYPVGFKSWYYKQNGKILYFVESRIEDKYNPVKAELQKRIESETKI